MSTILILSTRELEELWSVDFIEELAAETRANLSQVIRTALNEFCWLPAETVKGETMRLIRGPVQATSETAKRPREQTPPE